MKLAKNIEKWNIFSNTCVISVFESFSIGKNCVLNTAKFYVKFNIFSVIKNDLMSGLSAGWWSYLQESAIEVKLQKCFFPCQLSHIWWRFIAYDVLPYSDILLKVENLKNS